MEYNTHRYQILQLPDFKLFIHGYKINYDGLRTVDSLMQYVEKNLEETLDEVETNDDLQDVFPFFELKR